MLSHISINQYDILLTMDFALFSFEQLEMWNLSMDFVTEVYKLLIQFPENEKYALTSQIRRAAISIPSNIAEGTGRTSIKEKLHFNEIAMGSLAEVICQLNIAKRLEYINEDDFSRFKTMGVRIGMMLSGYRRSMINKLT